MQRKKSSSHHSNFLNQNRYFTAGLFLIISYPYPSKESEVPDFLSFIIFKRSLRYCYCLQPPYPNYPVIPQGPKHSSLLTGLIIILSLGLCASFVAGPSLVWSEVPVVLFGRPSSSVRGTKRAMDSGHTVQSEVLDMPMDKCQSVRSGA